MSEDNNQPWWNDPDKVSGMMATATLIACIWVIFIVLGTITKWIFF